MTARHTRILHVIDHLGHGGAQVILMNLCTAPSSAGAALSHEVIVLHGDGLYAQKLREFAVPVRSLACARDHLHSIVMRLAAHVSRLDYDVLHLHLGVSSLLGAALATVFSRRPVVITIYSLRQQHPGMSFRGFKLADLRANRFISLWDNSDLADIGVRREKVAVIPIGIDVRGADPARHAAVRESLCAEYGIAKERPLLLSVARLSADRHIHLMLEGMAHLLADRPDAALIMVGDGAEHARLETFVAQNHLQQGVIFAGSRSDIWNLLPGCDIYLSSSGCCDTGVAAMQAMACARPVVAYTIAPESMRTDAQRCTGQGVFIQARDPRAFARAALDLLDDPAAADDLARQGRGQILAQFSLESMVDRYADLYHELG